MLTRTEPERTIRSGTYYRKETPLEVVRILNNARASRVTLRLYYGDTKTGRDWLEEHDVVGRIGRSVGPVKVPLLVEEGEIGGSPILDHCIVKIKVVKDNKVVYQHPLYHTGEFARHPITPDNELYGEGFRFAVKVDGKEHANFKTKKQADAYIAMMT